MVHIVTNQNITRNLRLLFSYGKSTADVSRRLGMNRHQINKYINGHATPSLQSLQRICDFFGVEQSEVLQDPQSFARLVRLKPPNVRARSLSTDLLAARIFRSSDLDVELLARHAGYYHYYQKSTLIEGKYYRGISRIFHDGSHWGLKTLDRNLDKALNLPRTLKYAGQVTTSLGSIVCIERAREGDSFHTTYLYGSKYRQPSFLTGLVIGTSPDGAGEITCRRVIWHYLGQRPDLRLAIRQCGIADQPQEKLPDFVSLGTTTNMKDEELLRPWLG
jgi:transcriptional regulator with XRE-family HTH domain